MTQIFKWMRLVLKITPQNTGYLRAPVKITCMSTHLKHINTTCFSMPIMLHDLLTFFQWQSFCTKHCQKAFNFLTPQVTSESLTKGLLLTMFWAKLHQKHVVQNCTTKMLGNLYISKTF